MRGEGRGQCRDAVWDDHYCASGSASFTHLEIGRRKVLESWWALAS